MKRFIFLVILLFVAFFYGGYQLGLRNGTNWTVEKMSDVFEKTNALRAGAIITHLGKFEDLIRGNTALLCESRDEVEQLAVEWNNCKSKGECAPALEGAFYTNVDQIVLGFEKIKCD